MVSIAWIDAKVKAIDLFENWNLLGPFVCYLHMEQLDSPCFSFLPSRESIAISAIATKNRNELRGRQNTYTTAFQIASEEFNDKSAYAVKDKIESTDFSRCFIALEEGT